MRVLSPTKPSGWATVKKRWPRKRGQEGEIQLQGEMMRRSAWLAIDAKTEVDGRHAGDPQQ